MTSIHQKITRAFLFLATVIVFISVFAYTDLLVLKNQVNEGEVVLRFKNNILEMRRHEKNFFLYHNQDELSLSIQYMEKNLESLNHQAHIFNQINDRDISQAIRLILEQYRQLMREYSKQWQLPEGKILADNIRSMGQQLSLLTDQLDSKERKILADSIQNTQWALVGAILVVALITLLIGIRMAKVVVTPLKNLENNLSGIAQGQFDHLTQSQQDQEIVAVTQAMNRMFTELELHQKRVMQAEKLASLGVLVSGVAHELNNPLGNVLSSCQLLIEEFDSAEKALLIDWLQQIDTETERACRIVKSLQDFGRPKEFLLETVNLGELVDQTLLLLNREMDGHCQITKEIPDELAICVDPQRFQQVIINLTKNALDSAEYPIFIKIQATQCQLTMEKIPNDAYVLGSLPSQSKKRAYCKITIEDNGPGIAKEIMEKIFDPFFTTRSSGKGMGIGLYIVQEIIQEHQGVISVSSVKDQGTRFSLYLPCQLNDQ